jgi:DNA repair exonuclease SbcCD nuclease subunit
METFLRTLETARERQVDAVIIPGDLWDCESVSSQTVNRLAEAFQAIAPVPVYIAPGNHDYLSAESSYRQSVLSARSMRPWPDNVHIFQAGTFTTTKHPTRPDVSFTGRAFQANVPVTERLLAQAVPRNADAAINILVFHGSLDGYAGGDSGWPGKLTAPFSAAELGALGFSYAAIGHYHDYTEIKTGDGRIAGAYSGCLCGRGLDEQGPRYAVFGTIEPSGQVKLEKAEFDNRRVVSISCDITGSTADEVVKDVEQFISEAGTRPVDIVHLKVEGRYPVGAEPDYLMPKFAGNFYHFQVEDVSRPDYLTNRFDLRTTEGKFIQAMLDLKKQAIESDGYIIDNSYDSEITPQIIEDALYYGLDALKQKKVVVRYVD